VLSCKLSQDENRMKKWRKWRLLCEHRRKTREITTGNVIFGDESSWYRFDKVESLRRRATTNFYCDDYSSVMCALSRPECKRSYTLCGKYTLETTEEYSYILS